jgi:uncharacterized protein with PIN domain
MGSSARSALLQLSSSRCSAMVRYDGRIGEWAIICDGCGLALISSTNRDIIHEAARFYRFLGAHYCQHCRHLYWQEVAQKPEADENPEPDQ